MKPIRFLAAFLHLLPSMAWADATFAPPQPGAAAVKAIGESTSRSLASRFADTVSPLGQGADPTGATDSAAAFSNVFSSASGRRITGAPGTFLLNSDVTLPAGDTWATVGTETALTGTGKLRFENLIPYQNVPIFARDIRSATYGSAYNGYQNVFQNADYVKATGTSPIVAKFGEGDAAGNGSTAWGGNFVGVCSGSGTTTCWATEFDIVDVSTNGNNNSFGVDIHAAGTHSAKAGLQFYANNASTGFKDLIRINAGTYNPVDPGAGSPGGIMTISGPNLTAKYGFNFVAGKFTLAEADLPSFQIGPTPTTPLSRVRITGGTATTGPSGATVGVTANDGGTSAVRDLNLLAALSGSISLGNGNGTQVQILDGGGTVANSLTLNGAATGGQVGVKATGTDTNISMALRTKGTGAFVFGNSGSGIEFQIKSSVANPVNYLTAYGTAAGASPYITSGGADSAVPVTIVGTGGAGVLTGAYTAQAADPTTSNIPAGQCADWSNTTTGTLKRWCNIGGALKSITYN